MIKYYAVASALKMFSCSTPTKNLYRWIGNNAGSKCRAKAGLPEEYLERAARILKLFDDINPDQKNLTVLELGTGWVHWEATVLRLFYETKTTLFDVWDNRQFEAFHAYFSGLLSQFNIGAGYPREKREQARNVLEAVLSDRSFDEVYARLGFRYIIKPSGSLQGLPDNQYDVCFSYNVFEHITRSIVPDYIKDIYRTLKPGGYSIQKIEISDHIANYDPGVCPKNYLKYSNATWKRFFENDVQYFNRIQRSEWLTAFQQAGFELMDKKSTYEPLGIKTHKQHKNLDPKDIHCTTLEVIHRKPQ